MPISGILQDAERGSLRGRGFGNGGAPTSGFHGEQAMKLSHQEPGARRVDLPLAYHRGRASGYKPRPAHSDNSFAVAESTARRLTGRENHYLGADLHIEDLSRFQQAILFRAALRL